MSIEELRKKIDAIDTQLVSLYRQRMAVSDEIGVYKRERGLPVYDAAREKVLLERLEEMAGPEHARGIRALYGVLLAQSRARQQKDLTEEPAEYGLLGEKLEHSYSPALHRLFGDYSYRLLPAAPDELDAFFQRRAFRGINVTIPYKEIVLPYLDTLSPLANAVGCVNTVVKDETGRLHGYNTDVYGFSELLDHAHAEVAGKKCIVLGSGGASKAVQYCLRERGAAEIAVISRHGTDNYENIGRHADAQVLINATPVGTYPHNEKTPLSLDGFDGLEWVIDLTYDPARTTLMQQAEGKGIHSENGLYMLAAQGKRASELFTGNTLPREKTDQAWRMLARDTANIVLIGMPGAGKTEAGKEVSRITGRPLIDTDEEIECETGMTCEKILTQSGEGYFREIEKQVVREAGKHRGIVIVTGGGTVTQEENLKALRWNGIIFERWRPLEKLAVKGRPLSVLPDGLSGLYEKRAPLYEAWRDERIETEGAEAAAQEIVRRFSARFEVTEE
ncbi:MAG: chorismate mutase [Clostridia bacterium]|nr:chorismate mutase [Clostridia bacterium]